MASRWPKLWLGAGLIGLSASTNAAGSHPPACPVPCPAPGPKVVVHVPPPEVTFKQAGPTCVRAPGPTCCPGGGLTCFPVTFPGPAAAPAFAPQPVLMAPPAYAPAPYTTLTSVAAPAMGYFPAPAMAYPPAPPMAYAPAPPMAFGPAPVPMAGYPAGPAPFASPAGPLASPGCGSGGGAASPAAHLEAMIAAHQAFEETDLKHRHAALVREYEEVSARMAARGLSAPAPRTFSPRAGLGKGAGAAAGLAPGATDQDVAREIAQLKADLGKVVEAVLEHERLLNQKK